MNWYKKAQIMRVRPEFWKSVGKWVLTDADKPRDRNLRPLGKPLDIGIGQDVFEFETEEDARLFAREREWKIVK